MKRNRTGNVFMALAFCLCLPLAACDNTLLQQYAAAEAATWAVVQPEYEALMRGELGAADFPEEKYGDRIALLQSRRIAIEAARR